MAVITERIQLSTKGNAQVINITEEVEEILQAAAIQDGIVCVSCIGSTGSLTTCEFEPGLCQDIPNIFNKLIPEGDYEHHKTWGDHNGHSHLRASLMGPSVVLPVQGGKLVVGTWQQIVFIDFDDHPRDRELVVTLMGE